MPVRANASPGYLWRLVLITVFCSGFGLWALYDGTVSYPRQIELWTAYDELPEETRNDQWKAVAEEHGWPTKKPEERHSAEIITQYVMVGLASPVGLLFFITLMRYRRRWIEADDSGLCTSWAAEVKFDEIVTLNKKQWQNKGIAKIKAKVGDRSRKIVLDDCKYDRDATETILRLVESNIEPEAIVGGPAEGPLQEDAQHDETESAEPEDSDSTVEHDAT